MTRKVIITLLKRHPTQMLIVLK